MRRLGGKSVLVLVCLALVVGGAFSGESLYWLATTRRELKGTSVDFDGGSNDARGWRSVKRWSKEEVEHGPTVLYYASSGFKASVFYYRDGKKVSGTRWRPDGRVEFQLTDGETREERRGPPWLWGVADQRTPSAPAWILDRDRWLRTLEESTP